MSELGTMLDARLKAGRVDLPIFPSSASEVMALGSRDDVDVKRLSDTVRRDPTLVAHVLRVANSPAFAPSSPVVSLPHAVARLGVRRVCEMALFVVCRTRVFKPSAKRAGIERQMLRHAIATATFAQEIARLRRLNVEEAFLLGLMHDIGAPVVLQLAADVAAEHRVAATDAEVDAEVKRLHEEVGASIARAWALPEKVAAAIGGHHGACTPSVALIQMADACAHVVLEESTPEAEAALRALPAAEALNLYPEDVDALFARRDAVRAAVEAFA